jgi:hypothetical protein
VDLTEWSRFVEERLDRPPLIRCRGKRPVDLGWTTGPWDEPDEWRQRLDGWAGNVAVLTGRGLLVLDVDLYKDGSEGSFEALLDTTRLQLETVTVLTPHGGRHYYYRYDPKVRVPSVPLDMFGYPGIDCKADGGCVLIPKDC